MKNINTRKFLLIILRIVKDIMRLSVSCLSVTILVSVCAENGWAIAKDPTIITHDMFWKMYDSIYLVCVPLILFGYGITGRYKVKDEICISVVLESGGESVPDNVEMPCEGSESCTGECSECVNYKVEVVD